MRRALLPVLFLSALAATGFRAPGALEDTYSLIHKHTLGEVQTVTMKLEGKFEDFSLISLATLSQKVTEVAADGGYTVEITTSDEKTTVNGEDVPDDGEATPVKTQKYDSKGNLIKDGSEEESEDSAIDVAFEYEPKAPVKMGETWTPEKEEGEPQPIDWTLTGKEEVDGKELLVIEGKGKGPEDETIESKVWVDPVTFIARKAVAVIKGLKTDGGPEGEMNITIEEKA